MRVTRAVVLCLMVALPAMPVCAAMAVFSPIWTL